MQETIGIYTLRLIKSNTCRSAPMADHKYPGRLTNYEKGTVWVVRALSVTICYVSTNYFRSALAGGPPQPTF